MNHQLEDVLVQIEAIIQEIESIKRRLCWLDDNDKAQQMEIDTLTKRILNDFPVEPWNDD